jgi:uncharacterized protein (TIGR02246 family)
MRRTTFFANLAPISLCLAIAHAQTPESLKLRSEDERAARQVMADFQSVWTAHDTKALAELCTEDADFVVISGKHVQGRDQIYAYHDALHKTALKDRTNQNHVENIRFIRPDVAIMHVRFEGKSRLPEGDKRGDTTARATVVVEKEQGKWLISAFHNTLVLHPACRVVGGVFKCPE